MMTKKNSDKTKDQSKHDGDEASANRLAQLTQNQEDGKTGKLSLGAQLRNSFLQVC